MIKKISVTICFWLFSLLIWQIIFNSNSNLTPILWEIHTIYSCVLIFYVLLSYVISAHFFDAIKIVFRILFKVWFVILIAFSMKKTIDNKGFLLSATFIFGYLEGLIDLNTWIVNKNFFLIFENKFENNKLNRLLICIILLSIIHIISAFIAYLFFDIL